MNPAMLPERIAAKVTVDASGCWTWGGAVDPTGYGRVSYKPSMAYIHRLVYRLLVDPAFPVYGGQHSLTIDHCCECKRCINPAHLEAVTRGENVRRYWARRRAAA